MDLNRLISGIAQSGLASGLAGGVAGGALSGALMSSKKGRKYAATAVRVGGLAAIGGLAWKAYQSYRDGQPGGRAPADPRRAMDAHGDTGARLPRPARLPRSAFEPDAADASRDSTGLLLIRAMIAAARADGHIDAEEKGRIFARVETLDLSGAEKALLFDELAQPARVERLLEGVHDTGTAVEVYAASLLAIDAGRPEARVYLEDLAEHLALPAPLVREIHAQATSEATSRVRAA